MTATAIIPRKLPFLFLMLMAFAGLAQNHAEIKGRVLDSVSYQPLALATIAVVNVQDSLSSLVSYTVTDKTGAFTLHNLPSGVQLKILITYVGCYPFRKIITLNKNQAVDIGEVLLNQKDLKEIAVKDRMPIVIRKDTIEFNAEAFKTRPNAVVEDLLKKLPGVEVDIEGIITVNGKSVSKILVDGREFFSNDPRIASKNLDADMVEKVQVYDDREDDPDHLVPAAKLNKIINLKFKKALKKSAFGKIYAGGGTEGHYSVGGLYNIFRDTLQVSMLALSNNLNNTGFDFNDIYQGAGLGRGGEAFYRGGLSAFGGSAGIQTVTSGGININDDYGKKLKINLAYYYSQTRSRNNSVNNTQQFINVYTIPTLNDTTLTTKNADNHSSTAIKHNITGLIRWQPDDVTQIKYTPIFSYNDNLSNQNSFGSSFSNFAPLINQTENSNSTDGSSFQFQHQFSYNHQLNRKGESISIEHSLMFNPAKSVSYNNNELQSYTAFPSYLLKRYANNEDNNTNASLAVSYRYPVIKNLALSIGLSTEYNYQLDNVYTYDFDPITGEYDTYLTAQSANLTRNKWIHNIRPGLTYNFGNSVSIEIDMLAQLQQVNNKFYRNISDINQNYFTFLPNVQLNAGSFSFNYSASTTLPNIGDMIPYSITFSPSYSITGNPDLKLTRHNNFAIGYNNYSSQSQVSFNLSASASFEKSGVFRQKTLNAQLAETSMPINRDGRYTISVGSYISKRFKKQNDIRLNGTISINLSKSYNFFEINHRDGNQNNYHATLSPRLSINYREILEIEPSYSLNQTFTSYSGVDYGNQSNTTHNVDTRFNIFLPKKLTIEGDFSYNYNPVVSPGFQKSINLFSLSIDRPLMKKDRGNIKLSCYDILNQNIGSNRYVVDNTVTDIESQILKRYFLLTLQFKFNKAITK
ncbi:TonB-dependent receptor family protein [Mucilaginibacter sp. HMF5004]|uniref:TonB-dependent receptor n=1 Tax=Mucilaginibacter rivuli TaxID=2857527 RepID=UPI001C5D72A1|nr:TonB-dependent receptor [Mucilaginibacter rivuli]MBW4889668.1 TonB-dependent receptor family protein [Mucilaginibacter rivuli]